MFFLNVELDISSYQTIVVGDMAKSLYLNWQETGKDEDFELLADSIMDDIREQIDIYVENITAQNVSVA